MKLVHVFAYGSLMSGDADKPARGVPARLWGWRRSWGVAMDNTRDLPGYKHYLDEAGGRPAVYVAFLDIRPAPGEWVNGLAMVVDAAALARLDARERNYRRVEVVVAGLPGPVWTYAGLREGRQRQSRGRQAGTLVASREYHDRVLDGFAGLGPGELADFHAATDPRPCPLADLRVINHPAPAPVAHAGAGR